MKVSYNWLCELTGVDWSPELMGEKLTACGVACEDIESTAKYLRNVIVGEVKSLEAVPNATKIRKATVDTGAGVLTVICGAPNVAVGQKIAFAQIGAEMANGMKIEKATIRGVESYGMICSESELGISNDHGGILVLDPSAVIGTPLAKHLEYDDYIMTFELTPNRPDLLSAIGIAREISVLAYSILKRPDAPVTESGEAAAKQVSVILEDPLGCPRYGARIIKNVKVAPSPWWLRKRLLTCGVRPISNVVDITNFVMLESGQPLHAFDYDKFGSNRVVVRKAQDKENFTTLDGKAHELTADVLLITNGKEPVALGGVMGGQNSEVSDSTTTILLEAAYFDPRVIRKSRKAVDKVTDASQRFEKGADPNGVIYALNRASQLLHELCGGEVAQGIVDEYPAPIKQKTISFRPSRCTSVLGVEVPTKRMQTILESLGCNTTDGNTMSVTVPTWRPDLEREIDLVEEVIRIEGFDALPCAINNKGPLYTPIHFDDRFKTELKQIVLACGFDETIWHGIVDSRLNELTNPGAPLVRIANPVSSDLDVLRNLMLPAMLTIIKHNQSHRNLDLTLFEVGSVFHPTGKGQEPKQEEKLLLAVTGNTPQTWRDKPRLLDFYDVSGVITRLASHFKWTMVEYKPKSAPWLDDDLAFEVFINGVSAGMAGQLANAVAKKMDFDAPVFCAELDIAVLLNQSQSRRIFQQLPIYPAAPRDLAMIVASSVKAGDLLAAIKETAGELAESAGIFDIYTGKQIEKGKKSVAISVTYRSAAGSLSGDKVDAAQKKVIDMLQQKFAAVIRDK